MEREAEKVRADSRKNKISKYLIGKETSLKSSNAKKMMPICPIIFQYYVQYSIAVQKKMVECLKNAPKSSASLSVSKSSRKYIQLWS